MNDKFENQKERLLAIKQEISLLYQQVNYLLRNEKPIELLDLDVLMNRTHTIYDHLCSINVGDESIDEDLPLDADALAGLFGGMMSEESAQEPEPEPAVDDEATIMAEPVAPPKEEPSREPVEEKPIEVELEPYSNTENEAIPEVEAQLVEEEQDEKTVPEAKEKPLGDEFGFFFRFEDIPEEERTQQIQPNNESKVVHVMEAVPEEEIPERDRVHGEDLVKDNPLVMPRMEEERKAEKEEIGRQSSAGVADVFGQDDADFELSTGETLGEKMIGEDHSLAAKLQQNPGRDLKSVIGINDKFLFVNELFGGSMEKYNKSIDNLNDLKTLNGAMIYLNELKIELQWNSSNEAYQKLAELVKRKFD